MVELQCRLQSLQRGKNKFIDASLTMKDNMSCNGKKRGPIQLRFPFEHTFANAVMQNDHREFCVHYWFFEKGDCSCAANTDTTDCYTPAEHFFFFKKSQIFKPQLSQIKLQRLQKLGNFPLKKKKKE